MNTTKHTPGPWFVDTDPEGAEDCQSVWYSNGQGVSAEIAGRICEPANAALIAAAPTMYAEGRELLAMLGQFAPNLLQSDEAKAFAATLDKAGAA